MKQFECFCLDTANQCLLREGLPLDLPPKPFAVLRYLVEHAGRLVTHDELLDALWPETYVQPQVLRTYMQDLRKALGDDAAHPRFIQTLPKRGYRFIATVLETNGEPAAPVNGPAADPAEMAAAAAVPAIVGRDAELAVLEGHAHPCRAGQRQVVFITGEAGIGKTALVDAFTGRMARDLGAGTGATLARGQCVQGLGGSEEYYPVMEALSQLCAGPHGEAACRVLASRSPAWLGSGHPHRQETAPAARPELPQRTLGDLCGALEELAAATPLVLIFEDLHWADEPTLNLISALARRRGPARLLVIATCRPVRNGMNDAGAIEDPLKRLLQDLELRRLCHEIALPPLSRRSVAALLCRELDQQELPAGLADFVCRRSEGNPLFVIAVLEHLLAEGMLVRARVQNTAAAGDGQGAGADAGRWQQAQPWPEVEAVVPHQLARMIELEVERLTQDEQRLLEAASLMHVAFPAWAVAAALELDAVEVEEACDSLARRLHFVVRAGQDELPDGSRTAFYVFAHGLYRQVLYQRQSDTRRARRHIRVAQRLGALFAGREASVAREMGMHYQAAGAYEQAARLLPQSVGVC